MALRATSSRPAPSSSKLRRRLQVALAAALLCAGCQGSQATPDGAVMSFYEDVGAGDYKAACEYIDPSLLQMMTIFAGPCPVALADEYGDVDVKNVQVDAAQVRISGNVAHIPQEAVTWDGVPAQDDSLDLVRRDGRWYIAGGG